MTFAFLFRGIKNLPILTRISVGANIVFDHPVHVEKLKTIVARTLDSLITQFNNTNPNVM